MPQNSKSNNIALLDKFQASKLRQTQLFQSKILESLFIWYLWYREKKLF